MATLKVVVDTSVENRFNTLLEGALIEEYGLLLGQRGCTRNVVLTTVKTPEDTEAGAQKEMDTQWIGMHAQQVRRMLCGGIEVIGFYYFGSLSEITRYQGMFQTIMTALAKMRSENILQKMNEEEIGLTLLTIALDIKKYSATIYKTQNKKVISNNAEVSFQNFSQHGQLFSATWPLSLNFLIRNKSSIKSQVSNHLQKEYQTINNSIGVVEGQIISGKNYDEKPAKISKKGERSTSNPPKKKKLRKKC